MAKNSSKRSLPLRGKQFVFAVGRRKEAIARVRLFKGKGENVVNGKPAAKYFTGPVDQLLWPRPFQVTETEGKYYVSAKIAGGGKNGHRDAFVLGVARALTKENEEYKKILRDNGLLTRDARIRERRMVGTGGKARRKKQSPKR